MTEKELLPLYLDLSSKRVVIFGGGRVAERKARLFSYYARVFVISKAFTPQLTQMGKEGALSLVQTDLSEGFERFFQDAFIAIPATNDPGLNGSIEMRAKELGILVNKVDGVGDVVVPSIVRKGPLSITISTKSPALTKYIRIKLDEELTEEYEGMARLLGQIRKELKIKVPDQEERSRRLWKVLQDYEVWRLLRKSYQEAYARACLDVFSDL
jgi:precorrin-2 dehydrogenase/sirohydrochlorin ferrochelatase